VAVERLLAPRDFARGLALVPEAERTDDRHALIQKGEGDACTFLDDNWCSIHRRFGEDALPDVCSQYPRRVSQVADRIELTGSISCPEVTRRLLHGERATDLVPCDGKAVGR